MDPTKTGPDGTGSGSATLLWYSWSMYSTIFAYLSYPLGVVTLYVFPGFLFYTGTNL
jgi:hypothetical protein